MLRFILYFILFYILYRVLKTVISVFIKDSNSPKINDQSPRKKSRFEDVEDAKYIEIKPEDEKKN